MPFLAALCAARALTSLALAQDPLLDLPVDRPARATSRPAVPPPPPTRPPEIPPVTIYGREVRAESAALVYVLDVSGSMDWDVQGYTTEDGAVARGSRLARAQAELARSIAALPESFAFNVLAYDCTTFAWRSDLARATPAAKREAIAWVRARQANGGTGTGPAVAQALRARTRLVVLLTDGDPNCGYVAADDWSGSAEKHRTCIRVANTQRAAVHVFGIGAWDAMRRWCEAVASDNGGTYTDVR